MRMCITAILAITFGSLFKIRIKRTLKRICIENKHGRQYRQAAHGGTYCNRNIATLHGEFNATLFNIVSFAVRISFLSDEGIFSGSYHHQISKKLCVKLEGIA